MVVVFKNIIVEFLGRRLFILGIERFYLIDFVGVSDFLCDIYFISDVLLIFGNGFYYNISRVIII